MTHRKPYIRGPTKPGTPSELSAWLPDPNSRRVQAAALTAFLLLMLYPFDIGKNRLVWDRICDAGHFSLMLVVGLLLNRVIRRRSWAKKYGPLVIVFAGIFLAILVEVVQPYFRRERSAMDALFGSLGSIGAVVLISGFRLTFSRSRAIYSLAICGVLQLLLLLPVIPAWKALQWRDEHFPVLADFEEPEQLLMWEPIDETDTTMKVSTVRSSQGSRSLLVESAPYTWGGVEFRGSEQHAETFSNLVFDVFSPSVPPLPFEVRIDDDQDCSVFENRFNRTFTLKSGWNSVRIPVAEIEHGPRDHLLHLHHIRRILFFTTQVSSMTRWNLDSVRFEVTVHGAV